MAGGNEKTGFFLPCWPIQFYLNDYGLSYRLYDGQKYSSCIVWHKTPITVNYAIFVGFMAPCKVHVNWLHDKIKHRLNQKGVNKDSINNMNNGQGKL